MDEDWSIGPEALSPRRTDVDAPAFERRQQDRNEARSLPRSLLLGLVLLATLLLRLVHVGQPIVENYVGRQVPTAMVARNLERGTGFLRPTLDTAPAPNYFVVEPPVYQAAVCGVRRLTGWPPGACGRAVSALATALGALGLFRLIVRREGPRTAFAAILAFAMLPVTLRYGRAFQPDALMLGMVLLGVDCWDRSARGQSRLWLIPGVLCLAAGLAAKVTSAFVLVPIWLVVLRRERLAARLLAASSLLPALLWYAWAARLLASGDGSAASAENRSIWLSAVGLSALASAGTLGHIGRFFLVRAFTPLGLVLAGWGLLSTRSDDRPDLWRTWAAAALAMLALMAAKLHHEYYWLALAPAVAAGLGRAWTLLSARHAAAAWACAAAFAAMSVTLSQSTFRTPAEWRDLEEAAARVRQVVPAGAWVVAPEPLLYQADHRGCRLEFTLAAARRAAAEWRAAQPPSIEGPMDLIEFYRSRGAGYLADVGAGPGDARRMDLHQAIRGRYKVLVDSTSVLIAALNPSE
jgi:4-amino-4-deoxy-L-arabinose transferase-like glycosyltransferase